jgi:hypothetical protein
MADGSNTRIMNMAKEPNTKLTELAERQVGKWRVSGPEIDGHAEYRSAKGGFLLVEDVDFVVDGTKIKIIQHIAYDQGTDTLQSHYMDTMGDDSTYTWILDGQKVRVSLGDKGSDTYFEATFSDDNSEYIGTWHYPSSENHDAEEEQIVYTRIE